MTPKESDVSEDFLKMVIEVEADQVTLVPDSLDQLTSDHGWDTIKNSRSIWGNDL